MELIIRMLDGSIPGWPGGVVASRSGNRHEGIEDLHDVGMYETCRPDLGHVPRASRSATGLASASKQTRQVVSSWITYWERKESRMDEAR
jgi:hypothetical protein